MNKTTLMTRYRTILTSAWAWLAATAVGATEFAQDPAVRRENERLRIEFALRRETDVAVQIENEAGAIVRRLAAGALGTNAPAPLRAGTLTQALEWDGKDDAGQPAGPGPFRVRVSAGLTARYDGMAFGSEERPDTLTNVIGLGAGPDGRVYVLSTRWNRIWWRATAIHVFRRTGEYERTLKPFSANLTPERAATLTPYLSPTGRPNPVVYRVLAMSYYPNEDLAQHMAVDPAGNVHFAVRKASYRPPADKWLASLAPDGGTAYETYAGGLLPSDTSAGHLFLAAAPDGRSVWATGLERGTGGKTSRDRPNRPVVRRIALPARDRAEPVFGDPAEAGAGDRRLNDPRGLAFDGRGRLFVADRGNNRVVILDAETGAFAGAFAVPEPGWIGAHRVTGAVYVHTPGRIVKFANDGSDFAETARLDLPELPKRDRARVNWSFALDATAEPAVLWVGRDRGDDTLLRTVETDAGFGPLERAGYAPARAYWNLAVGHDRQTVTCKVGGRTLRILHEETGETRDMRLSGSSGQTYRLGPNGHIYGMDHWRVAIRRWDRNGKFLPYPATADHPEYKGRLPSRPSGTTGWERGFDVDRHGNVYVKQRGPVYHGRKRVDMYDPNGRFLRTAIWVVSDGAYGPRVDPAGNIYMIESFRPVGQDMPAYFAGKLPHAEIERRSNTLEQYRWMYGSVVKFGPQGGAIWFPIVDEKRDAYAFEGETKLPPGMPSVEVDTSRFGGGTVDRGRLEGALWHRYGAAYVLDMHPSHNRRCHCTATEFEVDDFGRVFYTDQGRFRVVVLDTNGNELLTFGEYGNQDHCGPGSYVHDPQEGFLRPRRPNDPETLVSPFARPEIAFNWFTGLGVSDRFVYVADGGNRRVVRVGLTYREQIVATEIVP